MMRRIVLTWTFLAAMMLPIDVFGEPISGPFSAGDENRLTFTSVTAKFVRLRFEPGSSAPCVDELEIFGSDFPDKNIAAASRGGKAAASGCIGGYAVHRTEHLNDGRYGNDRSWIADPADRHPFVRIELPEPTPVDTVVFSRDCDGRYSDRLPKSVSLETSIDGEHYQSVGNIEFSIRPSNRFRADMARTWAGIELPAPPPPPGVKRNAQHESASYPVSLPAEWPRKDERGFENLALNDNASARTSSSLQGYDIHRVEHLNDGRLGNDRSWIAARNPCWAEIDLGDVYHVCHVAFGSDSSGRYRDRARSGFRSGSPRSTPRIPRPTPGSRSFLRIRRRSHCERIFDSNLEKPGMSASTSRPWRAATRHGSTNLKFTDEKSPFRSRKPDRSNRRIRRRNGPEKSGSTP